MEHIYVICLYRVQFTTMKAVVFCSVFFSVAMTTLSQPTYDLEQQQFCDGDCQQQDLKDLRDQFTAQFTAMKNEATAIRNEISQLQELKKQVDNLLQVFSGGGRTADNGTMLPSSIPSSPCKYCASL